MSKSPAVLEPRGCCPAGLMLPHNFDFQLPFAEGKDYFLFIVADISQLKHDQSPPPCTPHISTLYPYRDLVILRSDQ